MPAPKLWAYVKMLPALQARDSITRINEMALAFGSLDKQKADEMIFNLQAAAALSGIKMPKAYRPKSPQEMAALAGSSTRVFG